MYQCYARNLVLIRTISHLHNSMSGYITIVNRYIRDKTEIIIKKQK